MPIDYRRLKFAVHIMKYLLLVSGTLWLALCPVVSLGQDNQLKDAKYYVQQARQAYADKRYPDLVENMKLALALRPTHQTYMYYLAIGYALTGHKQEAVSLIAQAAQMGLIYDIETDANFAALKNDAGFQTVLRQLQANRLPISNSVVAFHAPEPDLIPEGLAYDPLTRTFYLGSVYQRKIVSVDAQGRAADFSSAADGLWSVMGMKVDVARRLLWVSTAAQPQMRGFDKNEQGRSAICKYDLTTKRLIKKYILLAQDKAHWLGDLVVNRHGDVFTSDSLSPAIYVIDHRKDELELFMAGTPFVNPQGLALTADEKQLFMADYSLGLFRIDLKTKKYLNLSPPPNATLLGIDGLYAYQGTLIGVQNGINPNRIVRLYLNKQLTGVESLKVLEANNPLFDEPTLGALDARSFYFIANSQWGAVGQDGQLNNQRKLQAPTILKVNLDH